MTNGSGASVVVPLCQTASISTSVVGYSFWIYMQGTAFPAGRNLVVFMDSYGAVLAASGMGAPTPGTWEHVYGTVSSSVSANYFGFILSPGGNWSGTVYIDSVELTPG
jgi:hypothetical protein